MAGTARATEAGPAIPGIADAFEVPGQPELMAIRVTADMPPRPEPLSRLASAWIAGLSLPRGHVAMHFPDGLAPALICDRPQGEPLGRGLRPARAWGEAELIACVLRPVVAMLAELQSRGLTHRAIRPDNVYQTRPGEPVTLGPAWARPPACDQPAWLEPPQSATCHPSGRGDGTIADDVHALGALLVLLAHGGPPPLADAPDTAIVSAKVEHGNYRAITAGLRLPLAVVELARGMLAEDPEHRPSPALLADPDAARARRIAARPIRRAQRGLAFGAATIWDTRVLAHQAATDPDTAAGLVEDGKIEKWVRHALGDPQLASAIEAVRLGRGGAAPGAKLAVCRLVALLDPLAPLSWDGLRFWPSAIGPLTAKPFAALGGALAEIAEADAVGEWAIIRVERANPAVVRMEWRDAGALLGTGQVGWLRLRYDRNPLLACQGVLAPYAVIGAGALLPALDRLASAPGRSRLPLDPDAVLFARVRNSRAAVEASDDTATPLGQLSCLVRVEQRWPGAATPTLAGWLAAACAEIVAAWPGKAARARLTQALAAAVAAGELAPIAALLRDHHARARDRRMSQDASERLRLLDERIGRARDRPGLTYAGAADVGREIAVACSALFAAIWVLGATFG